MRRARQRRIVRIKSPDILRGRGVLVAAGRSSLTSISAWSSLALHVVFAGVLTRAVSIARTPAPVREFVVYLEPTPPPPPVWEALPTPPAPDISLAIEPPPRPIPDPSPAELLTPVFAMADEPVEPPPDVDVEVILPPLEAAAAEVAAGPVYWSNVRAQLAEALSETTARWRGGETTVIWVTIELAEDGSPISVDIAPDAPRALAKAIRYALRRAAPFAAPPPGAPRRARVPVRFAR